MKGESLEGWLLGLGIGSDRSSELHEHLDLSSVLRSSIPTGFFQGRFLGAGFSGSVLGLPGTSGKVRLPMDWSSLGVCARLFFDCCIAK